jgi:hypothetical protein
MVRSGVLIMKFAIFNETGLPIAFYSEDVHGSRMIPVYGQPDEQGNVTIIGERANPACDIPADAVPITDEQWQEFIDHPGERCWTGSTVAPYVAPIAPASATDVDAERDRRIAAGFTFNGKLYQAREQDLRNINGAATGAALALIQGATPGDLRWQGGDTDFGWIAADNTIVLMDVVTMVNFGRAAMAHVERLTMLGRSLKDRLAAGETLDISDDARWSD